MGEKKPFKVLCKNIQKVIKVNLWRQISFLFMEHYVAETVQLTVSCIICWDTFEFWKSHITAIISGNCFIQPVVCLPLQVLQHYLISLSSWSELKLIMYKC